MENFYANRNKRRKGLGKSLGYLVSRTLSGINQNVTKFYSPERIKLYSDLIRQNDKPI